MMTKKKDIYSSICLSLLFIAAILFTFTACGDDDDADEEGIEVGVTSRYVGQLIRPVSEDPD